MKNIVLEEKKRQQDYDNNIEKKNEEVSIIRIKCLKENNNLMGGKAYKKSAKEIDQNADICYSSTSLSDE